MSTIWKATLAFTLLAGFGACAEVRFGKIANCQNSGYSCELVCQSEDDCIEVFSNNIVIGPAQVDLLFVVDNSGSMSWEQAKIADRFSDLFDKIQDLDYRVAITTTDVSASMEDLAAIPEYPYASIPEKYGYYQDGKLLPMRIAGSPHPHYFLAPHLGTQSQLEDAFRQTIQREETLECDAKTLRTEFCPSGDERAIYAMNLALDNTNFFRTRAHLAVVIVSDEDERSKTKIENGVIVPNNPYSPTLNYFAPEDRPETFIAKFNKKFAIKTLGVHSIIVEPNDPSCMNAQRSQVMIDGRPAAAGNAGHLYKKLSDMTGGHVGSVCDSNYAAQMGQIGSTVVDQVSTVALACHPIDDRVEIQYISPPPNGIQVIYELEQKRIRFEPALPENTELKVHYECEL